jgi:hypothetical protein
LDLAAPLDLSNTIKDGLPVNELDSERCQIIPC